VRRAAAACGGSVEAAVDGKGAFTVTVALPRSA
jgi:hypothetical protein